jgi:hypothetical protein
MTKLLKPVTRELVQKDRGRTVIITIEPPDQITYRYKGKRTRYSVSLHNVQLLALMRSLYDKYLEKEDIWKKKKAAGYKNLKKPKPPTMSMFNKTYREFLQYERKD